MSLACEETRCSLYYYYHRRHHHHNRHRITHLKCCICYISEVYAYHVVVTKVGKVTGSSIFSSRNYQMSSDEARLLTDIVQGVKNFNGKLFFN